MSDFQFLNNQSNISLSLVEIQGGIPIIHNHPLECTTGLQRWLQLKGKQYRWWNLISVHPRASLEDPLFQSLLHFPWMLISCHLWWDDLTVKSNYFSSKEITRNMQIPSLLLWQGTLQGNSSIIPNDGIYGRFFTPSPSGWDQRSLFEVTVKQNSNFTNFCICQKVLWRQLQPRLRSKQCAYVWACKCVCVCLIHIYKNTCVGSS